MDEKSDHPRSSVTITAVDWRPITGRQGDELTRRLATLLLPPQRTEGEETNEAA